MKADPSAASTSPAAHPAERPCLWRGFGRHCWRGFRWLVRIGYALVALALYSAFHVHYVGIPEFLKAPLLAQLTALGVDLDYSRLRFRIGHGLIAENVTLRLPGGDPEDFTYVRSVRLELDWSPIWQREEPRISGLSLTGGESTKAVEGAPGEPSALLTFTEIDARLEFISRQEWRLSSLHAHLNHFLEFEAMGIVTNVTHLRTQRHEPSGRFDLKVPSLARALDRLERVEFMETPQLDLVFSLDGADLHGTVAQLRLGTAGVRSAYGDFEKLRLAVEVLPSEGQPSGSRGFVTLESAAVQTPWFSLESLEWRAETLFESFSELPTTLEWKLLAHALAHPAGRLAEIQLEATTTASPEPPSVIRAGVSDWSTTTLTAGPGYATRLELKTAGVSSRWGSTTNLSLEAQLWNSTNEWVPIAGDWELILGPTRTEVVQSESVIVAGNALAVPLTEQPTLTAFWTNLAPWNLRLLVIGDELSVQSGPLTDSLRLGAVWQSGILALTNLNWRSPAGLVEGNLTLHTATRDFTAELSGETQISRLEPYVTPPRWQQVTNAGVKPENVIDFDLAASGRWPRWESDLTNWFPQLRENLEFQATIQATNFGWAHLNLRDLRLPIEYTRNQVSLSSFGWKQGDGELTASARYNLLNDEFQVEANSSLNPLDFRPWMGSGELARQVDFLKFSDPPRLQLQAWGDAARPDRLGLDATVAITNASYRREPISELRTALSFTNHNIVFVGTELRQGTNGARAPLMRFDLETQLLHLTNAQARFPIDSLGRIIGPKTAKTLSPYQFPYPPEVQATGSIPTANGADANVVMRVQAPVLEWWYFRLTNVLATVGWSEDSLSITNVAAGFYDGLMSAKIGIQLNSPTNQPGFRDTLFSADATFAEVNLTSLMADLTSSTNRLEGLLSGQVIIEEGHSNPRLPWRGHGNAQIRDGLLWGLPLFGLLSPMFNSVIPGSGDARFNAGNAFFTLTNTVVDFSKVELLSSAMRLDMQGTVAFSGELDLVLEARPLRGVPILGALLDVVLSPVTRLLEYKVHGTLERPQADLRNVPSFLLAPIRPFKTLKTIFGGNSEPKLPDEGEVPKR